MHRFWIYAFILLSWFGITPLYASDYSFSVPSDPLVARQASIYQISADKHGLLWLATDTDGLLRFDGYRSLNWLNPDSGEYNRSNINRFVFTQQGELLLGSWGQGLTLLSQQRDNPLEFRADSENPHALASDRVQELFNDSQGRIWVGTVAGVNWAPANQPFMLRRFALHEPLHPLFQQRIWGIAELNQQLWFATSEGIVTLSPDLAEFQQFYLPDTQFAMQDRAREVRNIAVINNTVWATSGKGVFYFKDDCQCFIGVPLPESMASPRVNVLYQRNATHIWLGATDGLYQLNTVDFSWVTSQNSYNFLPNVDVRSLYENSSNQLWIGSRDQGVFIGTPQYQGFKPLTVTMPPELQDNGKRLVSALHYDLSGGLWLAAQNSLLHRTDDGIWQSIEFSTQYGIRKIYQINHSADGQLWLATDIGLFAVQGKELIAITEPFILSDTAISSVTDIDITDDGSFYLSIWQQGVIQWHPQQHRAMLTLKDINSNHGNQVLQLSVAADQHLFAATRYSGLYTKTPNLDQWQPLPLPTENMVEGFSCVLPEQQVLWLCSEYGLWRYNRQSAELNQYLPEQGLPSPYVNGAFFDHQKRLWVLTNNGPARFDQQLQRFISYGLADGLPDLTIQRNAFAVSTKGESVIGTAAGAVVLQAELTSESLTAPGIVLTNVTIDGVELPRKFGEDITQLSLPYNYRELQVQFAVIDYREPELNTARSRLLGLSEHWTVMDKSRELRYVDLAPGQYILEVQGQNSRGINTENPLRLIITVAAPWWYSTIIWVLVATVTLFGFLLILRWREASLRKHNQKLQDLVQQRTVELEKLTIKLKDRADHDPLTGLLNRAGFSKRFNKLLVDASEHAYPVSLLLIDIDHFKVLNDQYGHNAGDSVLQYFAEQLGLRLRRSDVLGRWGGEEFVIALANTDVHTAKMFCDALITQMQHEACAYQQWQLKISATFGVVSLATTETALEKWIWFADQALYRGKSNGRAQAVIAQPEQ